MRESVPTTFPLQQGAPRREGSVRSEVAPCSLTAIVLAGREPTARLAALVRDSLIALIVAALALTFTPGVARAVDDAPAPEGSVQVSAVAAAAAVERASGVEGVGNPFAADEEMLWKRAAGPDAFGTMFQILYAKDKYDYRVMYDRFDIAVLATSDGYWDALTASGLAGMCEGPVLITDPNTLSLETYMALQAGQCQAVIIVGGEQAVSENVERELERLLPGFADRDLNGVEQTKVVRLAGDTADDTACAVAEFMRAHGNDHPFMNVVATIDGYYDALSIAPEAYRMSSPIFLTQSGTGMVSEKAAEVMGKLSAGYLVVVGGTAAVSAECESKLAQSLDCSGACDVRLGGANAWETSNIIAEWALDACGFSTYAVGIADGNGYWDALTGAPLCALMGAPLLLVPHDGVTAQGDCFTYDPYCIDNYVRTHKDDLELGFVFGGPAAVPESAMEALKAATR